MAHLLQNLFVVAALVCSNVSATAAVAAGGALPLTVPTTAGQVEGTLDEFNNVRLWQGIPFAKPPVGDLRWEAPQAPGPFSGGSYKANYIAPGCAQDCVLPPGNCPLTYSEDCLYLTVFAPNTPPPSPDGYPVFVWLHGGAYTQGIGDCALYNGTTFAQQGVILVATNYRLGAMGFMASNEMEGNYGFLDQRMALTWTNANIKAFGGDPSKITLGGQSAGAMSTLTHLVSPGSQGLFSKAILESNPLALPYHTRESANANAELVFKYLDCPVGDVACMKGKSADDVVRAQKEAIKLDRNSLFQNFVPFSPLVNDKPTNPELPDQPFNLFAAGKFPVMPILAGSVHDEGQLFVYELFTKPMSSFSYHSTLDLIFGLHRSKHIKELYPMQCETCPPDNKDGRLAFNELATDLLFFCPLRNATRAFQAAAVPASAAAPIHIYRFKHVLSFDCWGANYTFCVGTVCHGSELPFVFNVFSDGNIEYKATAAELQLARDTGNAWVNFMKGADPNSPLAVPQKYVPYATASDELVILDEPTSGDADEAGTRSRFCDVWDSLGYLGW